MRETTRSREIKPVPSVREAGDKPKYDYARSQKERAEGRQSHNQHGDQSSLSGIRGSQGRAERLMSFDHRPPKYTNSGHSDSPPSYEETFLQDHQPHRTTGRDSRRNLAESTKAGEPANDRSATKSLSFVDRVLNRRGEGREEYSGGTAMKKGRLDSRVGIAGEVFS